MKEHYFHLKAPTDAPRGKTTLRHDLWNEGFRFGRVLLALAPSSDDEDKDGYWDARRWYWRCKEIDKTPRWLTDDSPLLDADFDNGFGCFEAPPVIAEDAESIYIHSDYDGSSTMHVIRKDLDHYLNNWLPDMGGG